MTYLFQSNTALVMKKSIVSFRLSLTLTLKSPRITKWSESKSSTTGGGGHGESSNYGRHRGGCEGGVVAIMEVEVGGHRGASWKVVAAMVVNRRIKEEAYC